MYILPPSIPKRIEGYRWQSFTPPQLGNPRRFRGPICHRHTQKQAAFIAHYEKLQRRLAADEAIYFADAVHPEYQSRPAHGWIKRSEKLALRRASGRQRINLHGALDLETFDCPLIEADRINATITIALLAKLEARNPDKRR